MARPNTVFMNHIGGPRSGVAGVAAAVVVPIRTGATPSKSTRWVSVGVLAGEESGVVHTISNSMMVHPAFVVTATTAADTTAAAFTAAWIIGTIGFFADRVRAHHADHSGARPVTEPTLIIGG